MSNLAQRIRDIRYKKGLGPDALAARAEISRTALYQIECGKTEVPRAGTIRRIARALDVPIDQLLGYWPSNDETDLQENSDSNLNISESKTNATDWAYPDDPELTSYPDAKRTFETAIARDDLFQKLEDLLDSRFGDSISRIIQETHKVMTSSRSPRTASRSISNGRARVTR